MKFEISFVSLLIIFVVVIGQDIGQQPQADSPVEIISLDKEGKDERWNTFKRVFTKKYASEQEEHKKRNVFEENCLKINEHNENYNKGFMCMSSNGTKTRKRCAESTIDDAYENSVGLNQLSDLTHNEIVDLYCGLRLPESLSKADEGFYIGTAGSDHVVDLTGVPKSFDWSQKPGYLSSIKNQMEHDSSCNSCWAFSAVDSLESQYRIKANKTLHLSQQNLVDCAYPEKDSCKSGGWMGRAFDYTDKFGINKFKDYLYDGVYKECRFNQSLSVLKTKGYKYVNNATMEIPNEDALVKAIYTIGPISVAIGFNQLELFTKYKSDIFKNIACRAKQIREFKHAMTAVGYGTTTEGEDYFILRNSWGTSWGENGYMRILRNKNLCGLGYYSVYPLLDLE